MDLMLQEMSFEELQDFAIVTEDDPIQNARSSESLSSIYYFMFLKVGDTRPLYEAIRKGNDAVAATPDADPEKTYILNNLGKKLAVNPNSLP